MPTLEYKVMGTKCITDCPFIMPVDSIMIGSRLCGKCPHHLETYKSIKTVHCGFRISNEARIEARMKELNTKED